MFTSKKIEEGKLLPVDNFSAISTELTDAGGQRRPNWQLTWPARVRSSDLDRHSVHWDERTRTRTVRMDLFHGDVAKAVGRTSPGAPVHIVSLSPSSL